MFFFHSQAHETAIADVQDLTSQFREKFFVAAQMSREERMAKKCNYTRDKRGQSLTHRISTDNSGTSNKVAESSMNGYSIEELNNSAEQSQDATLESVYEDGPGSNNDVDKYSGSRAEPIRQSKSDDYSFIASAAESDKR